MVKNVFLSIILTVCIIVPGFANYNYFTKLYTVSTKYFDIIFSDKSKDAALYLSTFADSYYENINAILKSTHQERFTVFVTLDTEEPNGYASVSPTPTTIALFPVYAPLEWTTGNCKDFLRDVFYHELVHAISLNIRGDFLGVLNAIFGNWVNANQNMPMFMMEGITVSFESLAGNGRINNPAVKEQLMQDALENRFRSPAQANGNLDTYNGRPAFYHYGGWFSHYLQQKYGMDKYSSLWHANANSPIAALGTGFAMNGDFWWLVPMGIQSVFQYNSAFYSVYNKSVSEEWGAFQSYIAYKGDIFENTNTVTTEKLDTESPVYANGKIYYIDHFNEMVKSVDVKTKTVDVLFEDESVNHLAISKDGKKMLVQKSFYYDRRIELIRLVTYEYDLENKCFTGKKYYGVREASYFGDSVIAMKTRSFFGDIVMIKPNGEEKTLLSGSEAQIMDRPVAINDKEIAFLIQDNGKSGIAKYNTETGQMTKLKTDGVDFPRNLAVYDNKIVFSYNNDFTFYKIGIIDGDKVMLQTNNYSGGSFFPMLDGDSIYYLGSFSAGSMVMKYPTSLSAFDGAVKQAVFEPFTLDKDKAAERKVLEKDIKDYFGLAYMLPRAWMPYFIAKGGNIMNGVDSVGLFTILKDPLGLNNIDLYVTYNYILPFANVNFNWDNYELPIHFKVAASDLLNYYTQFNGYLNQANISLDINYTFNFESLHNYLKLGAIAQYNKWTYNDSGIANASPYSWSAIYDESVAVTGYFKYSQFSMYHPYRLWDSMKGFELLGYFDFNYTTQRYKAEAEFHWYPYSIGMFYVPMMIDVYAGYSPFSVFNATASVQSAGGNHFAGLSEYTTATNTSQYFVAFNVQYLLWFWDIQAGWQEIPPLYLNRFTLALGYRGGYYANEYLHTAYLRADLQLPIMGGYGGYASYKVDLFAEGYFKINPGIQTFNASSTAAIMGWMGNSFGYSIGLNFVKQFDKN